MKKLARFVLPVLLLSAVPALGQGITTIGALPSATTPLSGPEYVPIWQNNGTKKVAISDILPNSGVTPGTYGDSTHCITGLQVAVNGTILAVSEAASASCPGSGGGGSGTADGIGLEARFKEPTDVAVWNNTIFVLDRALNGVRRITLTSKVL